MRSAASTVASTVQDPAHPANLALKGLDVHSVSSSTFHNELPQFLGYTNGKLHEYVMKSFRGSFAGFFNDALDVWSSSKRSVALSDVPSLGIASEEEPLCSAYLWNRTPGVKVDVLSKIYYSTGEVYSIPLWLSWMEATAAQRHKWVFM